MHKYSYLGCDDSIRSNGDEDDDDDAVVVVVMDETKSADDEVNDHVRDDDEAID